MAGSLCTPLSLLLSGPSRTDVGTDRAMHAGGQALGLRGTWVAPGRGSLSSCFVMEPGPWLG